MYIPGRFRTASRPSRTVMSWALYEPLLFEPFFFSGWLAKSFLPRGRCMAAHREKPRLRKPLSAGSGRYIRPPLILAGYPPNRTVRRATKCPQIATKWLLLATVRGRTGDEPQLGDGSRAQRGLQTSEKVG